MRLFKNTIHLAVAMLANALYGYPSRNMKVVGVTGTDGKTTTTYFTYQLLKSAGLKVGLISTVGAFVGDEELDTGLHVTNPDSMKLQKILSLMNKRGIKVVIIEVTSHGLDQHRVAGVNFDIAALTNITPEHMDYHTHFDEYVETKAKLFAMAKKVILNIDDKSGKKLFKRHKEKSLSYSSKVKSDFLLSISKNELIIKDNEGSHKMKFNVKGLYNAYNFTASVAIARVLKVEWKQISKASKKIELPEGRLTEIKNRKGIKIYVDFAHTPNSVEQVLKILKEDTKGKLIAVHGSAGERDFKKRKDMGKASSVADFTIFTAEDPRSEKVTDIINQMKKGATNKNVAMLERGEAITSAINKYAKRGDTVAILGKGHEKSMSYNGVEYPWSDKKAVEKALKGKVLKIKR